MRLKWIKSQKEISRLGWKRWESQRKKQKGVLGEKKSCQSDNTVTSLERKLEKQYGIDHRQEKNMTKEEGCTSSEKIVAVR